MQLLCVYIINLGWRGLGGGGGPFWLHKETLTFKGPAVYQIGVNKISPKFNMLCVTPLWVIWHFKGSVRCLCGLFGSKRLK